MLLHKDREQFEAVLNAVSNELGVPVSIVEKDYYVTMILKQLALKASGCVFKGGTSLSKCHHAINRFSEDIDITFSDKLSQGERQKLKNQVIAGISEYLELPIIDWDKTRSRRDYNSPIIDCFDGMLVTWTIGTSPNANLVNSMLDSAIKTLDKNEHPIVHSDRGCHYRWPGWIERMDNANLIRSMSKKGCSPDNSACEGVFGRLKIEMFYGVDWSSVTINEFISILNKYLIWYNEERIKSTLNYMSPLTYRKSLGLIA